MTEEHELMLEAFEGALDSGDKGALLKVIWYCARHRLPLPERTSTAFLKAYRDVTSFKKRSWDDVFGVPHRKGINLGYAQHKKKDGLNVYIRIRHLSTKKGRAIDNNLFEEVGREFGMSRAVCARVYAEARDEHRALMKRPPGRK
jgi:hypothetical protein